MKGDLTLECGCRPHQDADLEHIEGCPVIFVNKVLDGQADLYVMMEQVIELLSQSEDRLSLLLPDEEKKNE